VRRFNENVHPADSCWLDLHRKRGFRPEHIYASALLLWILAGVFILDRVYVPNTSNTIIIDAVEPPTKGIIDIPDMKKGWRWATSEQPQKADYIRRSPGRWSTDIMKVCGMVLYSVV
jgi:hypothetical protein